MITLKKSFELQNYLKSLFDEALSILSSQSNITVVTQEHMRSKVYTEAEDEITVLQKTTDLDCSVNDLIDFVCEVQKEMEALTKEINKAKHQKEKDFDGMIFTNSRKRQLLTELLDMANVKSKERMTRGRASKFNEEGNQVEYYYDIREVTKIDFDRKKVKSIANKLRKELDETSTAIDIMQLETMVDFESKFEIGDTLEDSIAKIQ